LTVGRQSRDHGPLSSDPSVTFYKKFPKCLERPKTLFDSRPTVAWPQPLSRDRSATFSEMLPNCLKLRKNVVWQSADGRMTSNYCHVTVEQLFSKIFSIPWNVGKTMKVSGRSRDCPATLLPCLFRTASHTLAYVFFLVIYYVLISMHEIGCGCKSLDWVQLWVYNYTWNAFGKAVREKTNASWLLLHQTSMLQFEAMHQSGSRACNILETPKYILSLKWSYLPVARMSICWTSNNDCWGWDTSRSLYSLVQP